MTLNMKKLIVGALCVFAAVAASAQVKQYNYDLAAFDSVNISNDFEATITPGDMNSLVLTVDEPLRDYVSINVKGGQLNVSLDTKNIPSDVKKLYKGKDAPKPTYKVDITMSSALSALNLKNKAVLADAPGIPTQPIFSVNVADNAQIKSLAAESETVKLNAAGKGSVKMDVRCENLTIDAAGNSSADISATAKKAVVAISGSSNLVFDGIALDLDYTIKGTAKAVLNGTSDNALFSCSGTTNTNAVNLSLVNASVSMNGLCTLTEAASSNLKIDISGGATLVFCAQPTIEIVAVKSATVTPYGR